MHSPWPQDGNRSLSSSYPSLYASEGSSSNLQMGQDNGFGYPIQSVGTDTSPDASNQDGSGSRSQSNHPTPSTLSNQNSTSYTSPPNQSGNSNPGSTGPGQSPGYVFGNSAFNMSMPSQLNSGVSPQQSNLNFGTTGMTPGPTGMTPVPDPLWPADGLTDGNEWMFSWSGQTPQPQ
jgi:hypothetical protein